MCACEPGSVCRRCALTPFDDGYTEDGREVSADEFESMSLACNARRARELRARRKVAA